MINYLPTEDRADPLEGYYKLLISDDYQTRLQASKAWNKWELTISQLLPNPKGYEKLEDDRWSLQHSRMEVRKLMARSIPFISDRVIPAAKTKLGLGLSLDTGHLLTLQFSGFRHTSS